MLGPIKVRISGDSKEHIEINGGKIYSSIDVRLLKIIFMGLLNLNFSFQKRGMGIPK